MKRFKLLVIFLFPAIHAFSQNPLPELLSSLKKAPQDSSKVLLYKALGDYYRNTNSDSAILYMQHGLKLSKRINYIKGTALINLTLAKCYLLTGQTDLAKKYYATSLHTYQQLKDQNGIASGLNGMGIIAATQGLDKEATTYFLKALKIRQTTNNTAGIVDSYLKLGRLAQQNNNLDQALVHYNKAVGLNRKLPVSGINGSLLNNMGIIYGKKNELKTALNYFIRALKITNNHEYADVHLLALINIGNVYQNQGDIKSALYYEKKALKLARERGQPEQQVNTLINLASLYSKSKPDSSVSLLHQALIIAQSMNLPHLLLDVYGSIVDLNKGLGNYKVAQETLEAKITLQDSLFTLKKSKEIAGLQANFDLVNEKLKVQQLQLKNTQIESSRKVILAISAGITLVLVLIIIFYSRTKQLNKNLIQQKEELNKLNIFKDKLFSIIGHDLRSPVSNIVKMLEVLKDNDLSAEETRILLPKLIQQSNGTLDVLDKLLTWGKLHLKGVDLNKTIFNAKDLVQKNLSLFKNTAAEKSIALLDETPEEVLIFADITHVDFIIRNVVANAIKYTHTGGKIEVLAAFNQIDGFNTIIIKDNGVGIAKEFQQKVFEAKNMSIEGTASEVGNSIGLMLCKEFTKENGGIIQLKSELGEGTQFCISFPFS